MGLILSPNRVIAKGVKNYLCHMCNINSMSRGNALAPNRRNSVPCTVRTSRQDCAIKRVGFVQQLGSGHAKTVWPQVDINRHLLYESYQYVSMNLCIILLQKTCESLNYKCFVIFLRDYFLTILFYLNLLKFGKFFYNNINLYLILGL